MEQTNRSGRWSRMMRAAFPATVPVMTGFLVLGFAYGVLMDTKGYGPLWSTLMSLLAFGGSMQYVAITLLTTVFDPIQAFLLSVMVNARHLFYGLALLEKYKGLGKVRGFLIFALCDETFSLVSTVEPPADVDRKDFYLGVSILNYSYWVLATAVGGLMGDLIPFDTTGVDFSMTALFVVIVTDQWLSRKNHLPALIGLGVSALCLLVFGPGNFIIPSMIGIALLLMLLRRHTEEVAP